MHFMVLKVAQKRHKLWIFLCVVSNSLCIFTNWQLFEQQYFETSHRAPRVQSVKIQSGRALEIIYKLGLLKCPYVVHTDQESSILEKFDFRK